MSLQVIQNELETIRQTVNETGSGVHLTALKQGLESLDSVLNDQKSHLLHVLVLYDEHLQPLHIQEFALSLGSSSADFFPGNSVETSRYVLHFHPVTHPLPVELGQPQAPAAIALLDQQTDLPLSLLRYLKVARLHTPIDAPVGQRQIPAGVLTLYGNYPPLPDEDKLWLEQLCNQTECKALREFAYIQALEQIALLNRDNIIQENRIIQLRKALQNQLGQAVKLEEGSFNASELSGQARNRIQGALAELEKNIKQQWEDAGKPQTGAFFHRATSLSEELETLEELENLEKSEKITLRPPTHFEEDFQAQVQSTLTQRFEIDAGLIQRSVGKLTDDINQLFTQQQVNPLAAPDDFRRRFDFKKITDSFATITKSYQGEMTKRGFTEYFVALREYTSLISTVVGLLMPIVIGIGGFEVLDEFVLKSKDQPQQVTSGVATAQDAAAVAANPAQKPSRWESMSFSQKLRTVVYTLSAVISIAMLAYGFYTLSHRIPLMREEVYQRELRRARDSLVAEGRRMFNDAGREWLGQVSNFCREQSVYLQNLSERAVKDFLQQRDKRLADSKNVIQRRNQGVDTLQRRLSSVDRAKDQSVQNISQLRRSIDQSVEQLIKRITAA
jgi:hypothetical protein